VEDLSPDGATVVASPRTQAGQDLDEPSIGTVNPSSLFMPIIPLSPQIRSSDATLLGTRLSNLNDSNSLVLAQSMDWLRKEEEDSDEAEALHPSPRPQTHKHKTMASGTSLRERAKL